MVPEVTQLDVAAEEVACRLREQDLATMACCRDPCRAVNVDANVALVGYDWLSGVQANPNPDRRVRQRLLRLHRRCERVLRTRKGDEEGVPLGVDLDSSVVHKCLPQKAPVFSERIRVPVPELLEQPRRPFDVREEKRDSAGW